MEKTIVKSNECVLKTKEAAKPMIYGYITPGIEYHEGYTKIGYTVQEVEDRIRQQTHTAGISVRDNEYWKGIAIFEDGSWKRFTDKDFHKYLRKLGYKQPQEEGNDRFDPDDINEWFHIGLDESKYKFRDFKENHGITETTKEVIPYKLREEQDEAVNMVLAYKDSHKDGKFLWNAKPRFGKTLSTFDFCKKANAKNVLIVTNRPAIAKSWFDDYELFFGIESGYLFVSEVSILKNLAGVLTRQEYLTTINSISDNNNKCIEFVSLQDLKGSKYFGGRIDKLREVKDMDWDILVIDEAHEGVDTYKTDVAFEQIKRKFTLHLSGTPFKALANDKFNNDEIFNWTYADEQKKKRDWDENSVIDNPYQDLPELQMYTYQMSEIIKGEVSKGIDIDGETVEYAFDLNEFFKVENGKFVHGSDVNKFLDALTTQKRFPFSTEELRNEIKHSFWLLDRVESARLLSKKLQNHPIFKDYEIILAAGDGKIDDDDENEASLNKVVKAIKESGKKTITLSVGQLTTGVTVPEWTAVLMLSNCKSPSLYMQAAFRAQNPCLFQDGEKFERKIRAYVFDFDPARTLTIYEVFANDLSTNTLAGSGSVEERKKNITELLNFFPVIGEDENGEMILLDAEKVMSIPRKIKSKEVVKRGFMSDFLFANISHVFNAPKEVIDILEKLAPTKEKKEPKVKLSKEVKKQLNIDEKGEVNLSDDYVIGRATELFGNKVYGNKDEIDDVLENDYSSSGLVESNTKLMKTIETNCILPIVNDLSETYGDKMRQRDKEQITNILKAKTQELLKKKTQEFLISENTLEDDKKKELQNRFNTNKTIEEIEQTYDKKMTEQQNSFKQDIYSAIDDLMNESKQIAVKTTETNINNREKNTIEEGVRDHLRGFARTIPSFLMAYGDNQVTLANFDKVIPDNVFEDITSITKEQFRLLRDGGDYVDNETNETKYFNGGLFDEVVFNDSIKEFLDLKKRLANYFEEANSEDIFDYIPTQKTNQIYTPKNVVTRMVDMLEEQNPGCFDDPNKTFIDLYMKSGLYITEIVKRLYNSEKMKKLFPDKKDRLNHIFEKQVYGLAPTEIIYNIATSFILGFSDEVEITKHNFRQVDAVPFAKDNTLKQKLDELFGDSNMQEV